MKKYSNLCTLNEILKETKVKGYAVGAFSPRYTPIILPIMEAAIETNSPVIVQISQKELTRYKITPKEFAREFYRILDLGYIKVPIALHLDHTYEFSIIREAIDSGFTSVMIDASRMEFSKNVQLTKEVAKYAHKRNVSVEGELGKIGTSDFIETNKDEELYTDPNEARKFVDKTKVDALAVSVGTAHGAYKVKRPVIDYERLDKIATLIDSYIVLHGGSCVPADMIIKAIKLKTTGVSKVNIATDIEISVLNYLKRDKRLTNQEMKKFDESKLNGMREAAKQTVKDKIINYLNSENMAWRK